MSWSGFKKNVGRATTTVMMKTGHVEKTNDRPYEVEERRYRTLEAASMRLQKEAKGYLDSLRAMTASQMRIAETIDAFYGDSGASDGVSRSYKQAVEDLDAETVKALDGPYRCVHPSLRKYATDEETGEVDKDTLMEIEAEMNFIGTRRNYTRGVTEQSDDVERTTMFIESIYRTTVLEPINRFCAYFPDINECIKKRNHKMLDYDSMRSKVKRLTEKPDKDPAKLPRVERETEMVSLTDFLHDPTPNTSDTPDLDIPSPPKASKAMELHQERVKKMQDEEDDLALRLSGVKSNRPTKTRISSLRLGEPFNFRLDEALFQRKASTHRRISSLKPVREESAKSSGTSSATQRSSEDQLVPPHVTQSRPSSQQSLRTALNSFPGPPADFAYTKPSPTRPPSSIRHPSFFEPSELEEIMRPIKENYIRAQTDEHKQAKAAYLALNEQLTTEIPQLIDLRVPYLDPSFEALVKIQLRFCAEAYSRMAQVQQYLDASTRDSYASGDLDARVEDVLGQIRELSIAGTV